MTSETGFLGDSVREFLEGEEKSNPSMYNTRARERTEAALFDFYYLFEYLDQEEIRKLFGSNSASLVGKQHQKAADEEVTAVEKGDLDDIPNLSATPSYIEFAIAFFLRGLNYGEQSVIPSYEEATGRQQPMFDQFTGPIEQGIQRYLRDRQDVYADVNVKIELENIRPSDELINEALAEVSETDL